MNRSCSTYRSFSTPAQIQAFSNAFFDRLKYANGDADEQHIPEPGVTVCETVEEWETVPTSDAGTAQERRKSFRGRSGT